MADIKIDVVGERDLIRQLRRVDKSLVDEMKALHRDAAEVVLAEARRRAPVRSGKLRGTLRVQAGQRYGRIALGDGKKGANGVPYAAPIHWGWPSRPNRRKRWRGGPIQANPFVTESAAAKRPQVFRVYETGVNRLIRKADLNP